MNEKYNVENMNVSPNAKGSNSKDNMDGIDSIRYTKALINNSKTTTDNVNDNDNLNTKTDDKPKNNGIENIDNTITNNKPKGYKNLVPITSRPTEEQREIQKKGGKARAEQMKQRMTMKENLKLLLECKLSSQQSIEITDEFANLVGEDTSVQNVLMIQTLKQAMGGDTKAIALVRDTIGEKPAEESIITADIMTDADRAVLANVIKRTSKDSTE